MSETGSIPQMWSKMAVDRLRKEAEWQKIRERMMPYTRGESWRSSLNRFVGRLNSEHERKLHPERYYEGPQ